MDNYSMNDPYENSLGQYGEYRQPYQSELDYFKNNTNVGGMATEDNKIILNPYSNLNDKERQQVGLNEGVRLFLRENPNYIGNFCLTKQQKQSLGNYSNNINDIRSTILARILTNDPSAGNATIRQKFNANRVRNAINRSLEQDSYYNKNRVNVINGLRGSSNINNYQQLGAMAQSLMGGNQDPRLQQLSQILSLYQQGL